ncbi:MAG TPA: bifunctional glutamine-synthetase adenylyltransferase/deadenyltransferase [Actinomycetota bacterium]|nr:bifunctional glutamine-synthetase adenylyltransferase/deadenyltransferase [Actinomycetota bacterium]
MTTPEVLGRALARAPEPELARVALSRVGEHPAARDILADPVLLERAVPLLGFSTAVADFLAAHPEEAALFADVAPRSREDLLAEAAALAARWGPAAGLRRFRRRALYRTAARDLDGAPFDDVVAEVTGIAEACLEAAVLEVGGDGLAVLGMGKLGGRELNYASDVDLIFVHAEPGAAAQEGAVRRAALVIALLSEPTAEGVALRVDASLRPEGRAGPLSRSAAATAEYYRRHAATWEKQALLKARAVAGDRPLGQRLLDDLADVVYPRDLEPSAIEDVRSMKGRIEEHVRARGREATSVKRGRGGIRDVEFAVQLLQLVHGRRDPALRVPDTLGALAALAEGGYAGAADAEAMADSYRFLRTLEHRLQLARDLPAQDLPADEGARARLARSMRLRDAAALAEAYERHTARVRGLHERLFYRPLLEAFAGPAAPRPGTDREATIELLSGLGFADAASAYDRLARLVDPRARLGRVFEHVFPVVIPALALAADPDAALARFERVAERLREDAGAPDRMAGDPDLARRLALAVAASSWLSDLLASGDGLPPLSHPAPPGARRQHRLLALGAAYAAGELPVPQAGRALSEVADAVIADAVAEASSGVPLAAVGLGKLGGRELNFASDVDLVFVFEGEGPEAFEEAERAAAAVLAGVRDRGFEPDADLRPEGRNGPLARSLAAYLEYWERWGQTWEFQALLKARFVAGDEALGRRLVSAATDFAYPEALPIERVAEIRRMRVRMEEERVRPPDARRFHFKLGYGGLADVTFAVELSQMRHGAEHPAVRRRNTLEALEALSRERLVEDSVSLALGEAYVFLNEVKNALEIERRVPAEALPPAPEGQRALARRLGYELHARQRFLEDYRRITRRARRAMERVFYGEDG